MTLHPEGEKGVNIDLGKYNTLKDFILETLKSECQIGVMKFYEKASEGL